MFVRCFPGFAEDVIEGSAEARDIGGGEFKSVSLAINVATAEVRAGMLVSTGALDAVDGTVGPAGIWISGFADFGSSGFPLSTRSDTTAKTSERRIRPTHSKMSVI
jgi:hypothetical protein